MGGRKDTVLDIRRSKGGDPKGTEDIRKTRAE